METFYRALYTIENGEHPPSNRRIRRKLPAGIIDIITEYVKEAAVDPGFLDCEQRMGVLKSSASFEIEEGVARLEKLGRSEKSFIANPEEDTVCSSYQVLGPFNSSYI
jgi:hypothetical protein